MSELIDWPLSEHRPSLTAEPAPLAVCVPIRDEEACLPRLLRALFRQTDAGPYRVCLVFDGHQPESRRYAQHMARAAGLNLSCKTISRHSSANAGRARRAALALGLEQIGADPCALVLTTDADTIPAPDWIATNRTALAQVDIVAGHIRRDKRHRLPGRDRLERYLDRLYQIERAIDPIGHESTPGHPSIGGASLGFRAGVYRALGGFPPQPAREDKQIALSARRAGYRFRRDRAVRVTTSSRLVGRACGGLADELNRQHTTSAAPRVEHPADAIARYHRAAAARDAFLQPERGPALARLAEYLPRPVHELRAAAAQARSADAFALRVLACDPPARETDLDVAEKELTHQSRALGLGAVYDRY